MVLRLASLLLVSCLLLAGCSSKGGSSGNDAAQSLTGLQATQDTGVIRGLVVDDAIHPVPGALVTLQNPSRNATTNADGAFGFDRLKAGTYFFTVSKKGYQTQQASADVVAGVANPRTAQVQIPQIPAGKPYHDLLKFNGNQAFGFTLYVPPNPATYDHPRLITAVPEVFNGKYEFVASYPQNPTWQQTILVWAAKTPAAQTFQVDECTYIGACSSSGTVLYENSWYGSSPMVFTSPPAQQAALAGNATAKDDLVVWAGGATGANPQADAGVTLDQDFRLIQLHTYNWQPADGYNFDHDGEPVDPVAATPGK